MMKINKKLTACAAVSVLCGSVFAQVTKIGVGKSVKGVAVDTKKFSPQIDARAKTNKEKDHEFKFNYPAGSPNSLKAGGILSENRISLASSAKFPGISATGMEPPDPDIAVGPSHLVEVVNSSIAFFNKQGTKVFEQTFQNFFRNISPEGFDFDPKVIFDQVSKRFVVLDLGLNDVAGGTSSFLIAVSDDADPNGNWNQFKVDVKQTEGSNNYWLDYPGLGYNKDMICATGNMFAMQGSSGFNGVQIICFDKAALYAGTATPTKFKIADGFTLQLAKTLDATTPAVYGVESQSRTAMRLTAITKAGNMFNVSQFPVPVPQWQNDQGFITGPSGIMVQTNDPRILVASSISGRLVASHSVASSSSDARPAARWYDFKLNGWPGAGTPTLAQSGNVIPPAGHGYSFPAISLDSRGGIGMTFSMIGNTTPGDVMGTGRKSSDPAGTMGNPIVLEKSTSGTYNGFSTRWGDYFDLELDPTDSRTFWAVGMGAGSNVGGRWQTFLKSFKISASDADLTAVVASGITAAGGKIASGNKDSLKATDSNLLKMTSEPMSGLGQVAGVNIGYLSPFSSVDAMRMFVTVAGPTGASALVTARNNTTGAYDVLLTIGLSTTPVSKTIDFSADQIAKYINSNRQISVIIRAVHPIRQGQIPATMTFSIDQASLGLFPKS